MAIAFVQATGVANTKVSGNLAVPVTNLPAVGNRLVMLVATDVLSVAVTDPRGNVWQSLVTQSSGEPLEMLTAQVAFAYTAGDVLTVTTGVAFTQRAITVAEFSGVSTALDPTRASSLHSTAFTVATTSPTITTSTGTPQSGDLIIGAVAVNGPIGDAYTADVTATNGAWAVGFTGAGTTGGSGGSNGTIRGQYKITTGAGAQTLAPTIASRVCDIGIVALLVPAPPNAQPPRVVRQAVSRAATWMKRGGIVVPRLWTPADPVSA